MADTNVNEDAPMPMTETPKEVEDTKQTAAASEKSDVEETSQNGHSKEQKDADKDTSAATEENGSVKKEEKEDKTTTEENKAADAEQAAPKVEEAEAAPVEEDIPLEDVKEDPELFKKIVQQIEYYFGNYNLPRDKFLSEEVKKDDGWVPLTIMLKFARLRKLTTSASVIVVALRGATDSIIEVHEDNAKIRRSPAKPLPELSEGLQEEAIKRTIYVKNFPKDGSVTLDILLEFFKQFGEYDSVRMRNYVDRATNAQGFKGSVLVVFKTPELAQKFLQMTNVRYNKTILNMMWFEKYLEIKKNEMEERQARKQARLNKGTEANGEDKAAPQFEELPRGNFLRATGFADKTTREDIKSAVFDMTNDCAFVDFRKGDEQAYIRFSEAGSNKEILAALQGNLTVNGAKITLFLVEGEEEEAQLTKGNEARRKAHAAGPHPKKRKQGGGYGGRGGKNKRQRTK